MNTVDYEEKGTIPSEAVENGVSNSLIHPAPAGAGHSDKAKEEIEKMAKELCGLDNECKDCRFDKVCISQNCANIFYNAGYRKRETSEWRITGDGGYGECANCGVAPFECEYPEDLRPGWAGYCSGCGAKMLGVNNGELLTWDQLSERRAREEAVRWAVSQGVCNYCDHLQKCSKYYEDQFPPDTPCMMKKRDFLEVEDEQH